MSKKFSSLFLVLALAVCGVFAPAASYASDYPMRSVTVMPNFGGIGLGTRHWETDKYGWGVEIQPSWEFNDFIYSATALWSPFPPKKSKQYFGAGIGGFSVNETASHSGIDMDYKVSGLTFKVFSGWEWLKGIKKNQGLSVEVGLQFGSADYSVDYSGSISGIPVSGTYADTYKMPVLYVGGTYAFYYNKK